MVNKDNIPWPPKSPADVLLLTPKKSRIGSIPGEPTSPSPVRRPSHPTPSALRRTPGALRLHDELDLDEDDDDEDDDDEELLKLKLARIEAKLKLKALQKKRKRADSVHDGSASTTQQTATSTICSVPRFENTTISTSKDTPRNEPAQTTTTAAAATAPTPARARFPRASTPPNIQVAASPTKQPPPSPSRVLLGLDRGLRAKDISLKRAPNLRYPPIAGVASTTTTRTTSRPQTSTSTNSASTPSDPFATRPITSSSAAGQERKTFNQRIAEARLAETEKTAKLKAIEKSRGKGWGVSEEELLRAREEQEKSGAQLSSLECLPQKVSIWASSSTTTATNTNTSTSTSANATPTPASTSRPRTTQSTTESRPQTSTSNPPSTTTTTTTTATAPSGAGFDSFSQLHLLSRHLPHPTLSRALSQKTIFLLPDLLKTITSATDFSPPDIPGDWVVMGIIASKSEPRQTQKSLSSSRSTDPANNSGGEKYMVLSLTDLKWDLELFLFGGGFEKFWKLGVGEVIAILNPGIMKPRVKDSGKFSLCLSSREETVLEVGTSRDLGWCKSLKKNGESCGMWIDKRRMEHCTWHVEMAVKKAQNQRMELSNVGKLFSPPRKGARGGWGGGGGGGGQGGRKGFLSRAGARGGGGAGEKFRDDGLLPEGNSLPDLPQRLGGAGGKVFILPSSGNANNLFDDSFADAFHNGTREERIKKQLKKAQREREIAKRLVEGSRRTGGGGDPSAGLVSGGNTGAEYLRKMVGGLGLNSNKSISTTSTNIPTSTPALSEDYSTLLKANRANLASTIKLSPIKRRRHLAPPTFPAPPPQPKLDATVHKDKKPKTVHFQRPVVTGGMVDEDDDLEIC